MKILALIPARYASTRFPAKPLALIHGQTMIQRVYSRVSQVFDHCYVATDHPLIESECLRFGGGVVMTSTEHRSGTDRCREAMEKIGGEWDVVLNIQGDEPFISISQLELVASLFEDERTEIGTLIKHFEGGEDIFNANSPKVVCDTEGFALYFSRSVIPYFRGLDEAQWHSSHVYNKHIGIYGYRADVLREITDLEPSSLEVAESLEQLRWIENGYKIKTAVTDERSYAIDTPDDLKEVEGLFAD
ncbi:MAG: 3-deoxy-manno-octulosonate cytidylyltransferase [Rikenellaceae bacterium]